jgi:hypothetical protein
MGVAEPLLWVMGMIRHPRSAEWGWPNYYFLFFSLYFLFFLKKMTFLEIFLEELVTFGPLQFFFNFGGKIEKAVKHRRIKYSFPFYFAMRLLESPLAPRWKLCYTFNSFFPIIVAAFKRANFLACP